MQGNEKDRDHEKELREQQEAEDRARGRTVAPGAAPKQDEVPVPDADKAPSASPQERQ